MSFYSQNFVKLLEHKHCSIDTWSQQNFKVSSNVFVIVYISVCVHMCACECRCTLTMVEVREQSWVLVLTFFLAWDKVSLLFTIECSRLAQPCFWEFSLPSISPQECWLYRYILPCLASVDYKDSNSGPWTFMISLQSPYSLNYMLKGRLSWVDPS